MRSPPRCQANPRLGKPAGLPGALVYCQSCMFSSLSACLVSAILLPATAASQAPRVAHRSLTGAVQCHVPLASPQRVFGTVSGAAPLLALFSPGCDPTPLLLPQLWRSCAIAAHGGGCGRSCSRDQLAPSHAALRWGGARKARWNCLPKVQPSQVTLWSNSGRTRTRNFPLRLLRPVIILAGIALTKTFAHPPPLGSRASAL